jgi:subtilisin family serine protease
MSGDRHHRKLLRLALCAAIGAAVALGSPAAAQLLGGGLLPGTLPGGLPALPPIDVPALPRLVDTVADIVRAPLADVRRLTAERLLRRHPDVLEPDDHGQPVVRGEILALGLGPGTLDRLRQAGFTVRESADLGELGISATVLGLPRDLTAVDALRRLRAIDPQGAYDFNHIYQASGEVRSGGGGMMPATDGRGLHIGLVDGTVVASRPALTGARLAQQPFAPGGAKASAHATAIASLIAGRVSDIGASAPGASLYVADVYGPTPTGGSAEAVAKGLAWLAKARTPVINISLVGPPNLILEAAVRAMVARGYLLVAAVGNDGPAAPPLYPAAYPGVVAVTAVDRRHRILPEASRGGHVDFAAQGSDMAAAGLSGGLVSVRGTSFAAPLVAGALARLLPEPDPAAAARALDILGRRAIDLGAPGPDPIYGRGLVEIVGR